jgi:hypothetical protein
MRIAARSAIVQACGGKKADIAQLEVNWPLFGDPSVDALVVAPTYSPNAEALARKQISTTMRASVLVNLQQLQAADFQSQTKAMVDAAMERTAAGIAADVPPYDRIRSSIGLPTRGIWANRAERRVYVEPMPAPGWKLIDYAEVEKSANAGNVAWNVRILPPPQEQLRVLLKAGDKPDDTAISPETAAWALKRWGLGSVSVVAPASEETGALVKRLVQAGVKAQVDSEETTAPREGQNLIATIRVYGKSPTERAKEAAEARKAAEAKAAAEKAAAEKSAANKP